MRVSDWLPVVIGLGVSGVVTLIGWLTRNLVEGLGTQVGKLDSRVDKLTDQMRTTGESVARIEGAIGTERKGRW